MNEDRKILNDLLVDMFQHILYIEETNLRKLGVDLTISEVHTLDAVAKATIPSMSNIAKGLMITIGSTTTAIKKLEAKGYVKREREESDARVVLVNLTEKAKKILEAHYHFHDQMVDEILCDLNDEEEKILLKALTKVKKHFFAEEEE